MDNGNLKRITVFAGHYGSGKTNIAINYAINAAASGIKTAIADLDIVNPYFRTKDAAKLLSESGVRLIASPYADTNVDTPALPAEAYSVIHDDSVHAIIDVGGDDRGALALGRYSPDIIKQGDYDMFFVINKYRYLTKHPNEAIEIMNEIQASTELRFTGIINNSNLGDETSAADVSDSIGYAKEVARLSGLELKMTTLRHDLEPELKDKIENLMPIRIYVRQAWQKS